MKKAEGKHVDKIGMSEWEKNNHPLMNKMQFRNQFKKENYLLIKEIIKL